MNKNILKKSLLFALTAQACIAISGCKSKNVLRSKENTKIYNLKDFSGSFVLNNDSLKIDMGVNELLSWKSFYGDLLIFEIYDTAKDDVRFVFYNKVTKETKNYSDLETFSNVDYEYALLLLKYRSGESEIIDTNFNTVIPKDSYDSVFSTYVKENAKEKNNIDYYEDFYYLTTIKGNNVERKCLQVNSKYKYSYQVETPTYKFIDEINKPMVGKKLDYNIDGGYEQYDRRIVYYDDNLNIRCVVPIDRKLSTNSIADSRVISTINNIIVQNYDIVHVSNNQFDKIDSDYDFIDYLYYYDSTTSSSKYLYCYIKAKTYTFDTKKGTSKELKDFKYDLRHSDWNYSEDGLYAYGEFVLFSKQYDQYKKEKIVMDGKGKIYEDSTIMDSSYISIKLDSKHYLSLGYNTKITDSNGKIISILDDGTYFASNIGKAIVTTKQIFGDYYYGVIDYDGNKIIDFNYTNCLFESVESYYLKDSNGDYYHLTFTNEHEYNLDAVNLPVFEIYSSHVNEYDEEKYKAVFGGATIDVEQLDIDAEDGFDVMNLTIHDSEGSKVEVNNAISFSTEIIGKETIVICETTTGIECYFVDATAEILF